MEDFRASQAIVRFGAFELDQAAGELRCKNSHSKSYKFCWNSRAK
jgi:hypothetical protein